MKKTVYGAEPWRSGPFEGPMASFRRLGSGCSIFTSSSPMVATETVVTPSAAGNGAGLLPVVAVGAATVFVLSLAGVI